MTVSERALKARLNRVRCFNTTHNVRHTRRRVCTGTRGILPERCGSDGVPPGSPRPFRASRSLDEDLAAGLISSGPGVAPSSVRVTGFDLPASRRLTVLPRLLLHSSVPPPAVPDLAAALQPDQSTTPRTGAACARRSTDWFFEASFDKKRAETSLGIRQMAVFRAEIQIKPQPLPVVRALLAFSPAPAGSSGRTQPAYHRELAA